MQILLAEDFQTYGSRVQYLLQMAGHRVTRADSEPELYAILEKGPFPVVVVQQSLLARNHFELSHWIKAQWPLDHSYIIMLMGPGQELPGLDEESSLVDDYLTCPVEAKLLRLRLHLAERLLKFEGKQNQFMALLPICRICKKVHPNQGLWHMVEQFFTERGRWWQEGMVCPDCLQQQPEVKSVSAVLE